MKNSKLNLLFFFVSYVIINIYEKRKGKQHEQKKRKICADIVKPSNTNYSNNKHI